MKLSLTFTTLVCAALGHAAGPVHDGATPPIGPPPSWTTSTEPFEIFDDVRRVDRYRSGIARSAEAPVWIGPVRESGTSGPSRGTS